MIGVRIYSQGYTVFEVMEFLCGIPIVTSSKSHEEEKRQKSKHCAGSRGSI